ncbi:MAG: hypothetical protein JXB34_04800 [Bacteroidales bacterium]|nr:hypothetical protein [Bacteroidales bacterium]
MIKTFTVILFSAILNYSTRAQENESPFSAEMSAIGDFTTIFTGGIKPGKAFYLGYLSMQATFDTEKAKWWNGGLLTAHVINTHGALPSENYAGDMQVYSNIEAGNHTSLFELFYSQKLGKIEL